MGFWSKLFGKKDDKKDEKVQPAMQANQPPAEDMPEVSPEEEEDK